MEVQPRNCPLCNTPPSRSDVIGSLTANHHKLKSGEFSLTYCACGELVYLSPAPGASDIHAMYAESRQFDQDEVYRGERAGAVKDFYTGRLGTLLAKMNKKKREAIRILEIGAGLSWVCRAAKSINPKSVTVAQDITSEAVGECTWVDHYYVGDIMDCREIEALAPYDLVSLTHVIEHLLDPVSVLKRIRDLTSPAGLVFVTAPHRPSGWTRGDNIGKWMQWSYNHVPGHLQYFSRGSLERAAREAGFEVAFWDSEQEEGQAFEAWLEPSALPEHSALPFVSMPTSARRQLSRYRSDFANARPFHYIVIDNFFEIKDRLGGFWTLIRNRLLKPGS